MTAGIKLISKLGRHAKPLRLPVPVCLSRANKFFSSRLNLSALVHQSLLKHMLKRGMSLYVYNLCVYVLYMSYIFIDIIKVLPKGFYQDVDYL